MNGRGVALGVLEAYHRTKAGKHWVMLRSHPYRYPYQAVPGVPKWLRVGELMVESGSADKAGNKGRAWHVGGVSGYFTRKPVRSREKIGDF